jgi:hypothetical protein
LRPQVSFTPSGNPIILESGVPEPRPNITILERPQQKADYDSTRRFYSSFAIRASREDVKLRFRWKATNVFGVDPSRLSFEVTSARQEKNGKLTASAPDRMAVEAFVDPNGIPDSLVLDYSVRPPESSLFVVFRLQMRGGVGNLQLPRWVRDWSTEDDCGSASATRTYRLGLLGDMLMANFAQDTVFAEQYIAIRRK